MIGRTSASELLSVWRRVAPDADRSLAIGAANEFYEREIDDPESLGRLVDALRLRLSEVHADFVRAFDYEWTVEEHAGLYHPAAEAQYQLHVIDCAATLWDTCAPERRKSESYGKLMARYSRLWGGVGSTSPRARYHAGVRFVIVPFGWDQHLHIALDGLRSFAPSLMPQDSVVALSVKRPEVLPAEAVPSWNALIARALASELGCHELLTPLCVQRVVERCPRLGSASSMLGRVDVLDAQLSRCSLAMLFSVAHEVGHHLGEALPPLPGEGSEAHADRLALNALWDCPGSARSLKRTDEPDDALTLLSGGLFFSAVEIGTAVERAVRRHVTRERQRPSALVGRVSTWLMAVEQVVSRLPELRYAVDAACSVYAMSRTYSQAMSRYAESVLGEVEPVAREVVDELHRDNPDLHDIPALERRIRGGDDDEL